jgi:hypothetical protein
MMKNNIAKNRIGKRTACTAQRANITAKRICANGIYFFLIVIVPGLVQIREREEKNFEP